MFYLLKQKKSSTPHHINDVHVTAACILENDSHTSHCNSSQWVRRLLRVPVQGPLWHVLPPELGNPKLTNSKLFPVDYIGRSPKKFQHMSWWECTWKRSTKPMYIITMLITRYKMCWKVRKGCLDLVTLTFLVAMLKSEQKFFSRRLTTASHCNLM